MLETITQNTIAQYHHHAFVNSRDTASNRLQKRFSQHVLLVQSSFMSSSGENRVVAGSRSVSRVRTDSNDIRLSKFLRSAM